MSETPKDAIFLKGTVCAQLTCITFQITSGGKISIMLLGNSRSYSGRAEERKDHFVPTTPHSRSHLNLICVACPFPCFRRGRNEGSEDCKGLREFVKLTDDTAGMVGDRWFTSKIQLLCLVPL